MKVPNTRQSMNKRRVSFAPEATLHTFELVESSSLGGSQMNQPARKRESGANKELASIFLNAAAAATTNDLDNVEAPPNNQQISQNEKDSASHQLNDESDINKDESDMELDSTADIFAATKATIQEYEAREKNDSPKLAGNTVTTSIPTSMSIENFADGLGDTSRRESDTQQSQVELSELELSRQEDHLQKIQPEEEHTMDMTRMFGLVKTRVEMESQLIATEGQVDHIITEEHSMELTNVLTVPGAMDDNYEEGKMNQTVTEEHTMELTNLNTVPSSIKDNAAEIDLSKNTSISAEEDMEFTNVVNTKPSEGENEEQDMELTTVLTKDLNNDNDVDMDFTTILPNPATSARDDTSRSGEDEKEQKMDFTTVSANTLQPVSHDDEEQDMDLTNFPTTTTQPVRFDDNEEQDMDLTTISATNREILLDEDEEADMDFTTIPKTHVTLANSSADNDENEGEEDRDFTTIQKVTEEDDMDFTNIPRQNEEAVDMDLKNVLDFTADDSSKLSNQPVASKLITPQKQPSPNHTSISSPKLMVTPKRSTKENNTPNGSALKSQATSETVNGSPTKRKISLSLRPPNSALAIVPMSKSKSVPSTPNRTRDASATTNRTRDASATPKKQILSFNSVNIGNKKRRLSVSTILDSSHSPSLKETQPLLTPSKAKLLENKILTMSPRKTHSRRVQPYERPASSSTSFTTADPYVSDILTPAVTYTPLNRMRKDSLGITTQRLSLVSMSPTPKKGMDNNYTFLSSVLERDEEDIEELQEMDQYPLVSLTEFLKSIKVEFLDNLFSIKSSLYDAPVLFTTKDNAESPTWQLADFASAITKIPRLEMYTFSIHEMRKNIADARLMFEQLEQETREGANPLVFREFLEAGPEMKQIMIDQFSLTKQFSRAQVCSLWYEWRLKLTGGVQEGLTRRRQIVEDDRALLSERTRALDMISLKERILQKHKALKARLEALHHQNAELDKYGKAQMDEMRTELVAAKRRFKDATARVEKQRARSAELDLQLQKVNTESNTLEQDIEDFRRTIARNQTDEQDLCRQVKELTKRRMILQAHSGVKFVRADAAAKSIIVLKVGARFLVHYDIKMQKTVSVHPDPDSSSTGVVLKDSISSANETAILAYFFANPALREYNIQQIAAYLQAVAVFQKNVDRLSFHYPTTVALGLEGNKDNNSLTVSVKILHYPNAHTGAKALPQPPIKKTIVRVSVTNFNPTSFSSCSLETYYPRPASTVTTNCSVSSKLTERLNKAFKGSDTNQFLSFFVQSTA